MIDQKNLNIQKQPFLPRWARRLLFVVLLVVGFGAVSWELYAISPEIRVAVVHGLGWVGPSALPTVIDYSEDDSERVHKAASDVLRQSGAQALPALERSLTDGGAARRQFAASMLGQIGPHAAAPALIEAASKDTDIKVRMTAIAGLSEVGMQDPKIVDLLIGWLSDPKHEIRQTAALTLGHVGPKAKPAVAALIKGLKDAHPSVRQGSAAGLKLIGPDAAAAVPALTEAATDPFFSVQWEATEALACITGIRN